MRPDQFRKGEYSPCGDGRVESRVEGDGGEEVGDMDLEWWVDVDVREEQGEIGEVLSHVSDVTIEFPYSCPGGKGW